MSSGSERRPEWILPWKRHASHPRSRPAAKPLILVALAGALVAVLAPLAWWTSMHIGFASPHGGSACSSTVQLSNLAASDSANAQNWSLQTNLQSGIAQYGDRGYTFSSVPAELVGAAWIRTANSSKAYTGNPTVTFVTDQQATIYVAVDARLAEPAWMDASWTNSGLTLTDNQAAGANAFVLYAASAPAGTVSLGPNDNGNTGVNMYTVIAVGAGTCGTPTATPVATASATTTSTATAAPTASTTSTPVPGVAEVVYCQPNFTTGTLHPVGQNSLKNPSQIAADGQGGFYAVDYGNSRVLHFPAFNSTGIGPQADRVYGQPNYVSSSPSRGATHLNFPHGVALDPAGGLYISDMYNNRVLHYPAGSTTADRVYGQPDFNSGSPNNGGLSAHSLSLPQGIAVDSAGGLYVADSGNNRVLHFPAGSTTADFVYGQSRFTTSGAAAGASGLHTPRDVKVSPAGVFIVDSGNQRILQFTPGNATATRVYGQPDFASIKVNQGHGPTATTLNNPTGIAFDALGGLYVGDRNNERVLFFPPSAQTATGNDPAAVAVYGQPGFTTSGKGTTASSFNGPGAISVDANGNLFVLDIFNQRVLKFAAQE